MADQPHFIILQGEDTSRSLGCYGERFATTPNLDALAHSGCRYDQAWSTAPVCSPSRSSFISGQYPWSLGTHHHPSKLVTAPKIFTECLREAGYHVNWSCKTHFNFKPPVNFADSQEEWLDAFIEHQHYASCQDQPLFLYHNFFVTHESTMWRHETRGGAYVRRLANQHLLPHHHDPDAVPVPPYLPDTPEVRGDIARYFDALAIQDAQIGLFLQALAQSPYADNTYVIYLSDHGRGLMREKRWCYAAGCHMPFIIRGPGITPGSVCDDLVSWVDLAPTILKLAGAPALPGAQGIDIFSQKREFCFSGRGRMKETYDCQRTVTDGRYLFICNDEPDLPYVQPNNYEQIQATTKAMFELHAEGRLSGHAAAWFAARKAKEELYDLRNDPHNLCNIIDHPDHRSAAETLRRALSRHRRDINDLGLVSERELIDRGILVDELAATNKFRFQQAAPFRVAGRAYCQLEMPGHETQADPPPQSLW